MKPQIVLATAVLNLLPASGKVTAHASTTHVVSANPAKITSTQKITMAKPSKIQIDMFSIGGTISPVRRLSFATKLSISVSPIAPVAQPDRATDF